MKPNGLSWQLPQTLSRSQKLLFSEKAKLDGESEIYTNWNAMNSKDADMIEADAMAPQPQPLGLSADFNGDVRNFLSMARQLIDQGKPSQALQAVTFSFLIINLLISILISFFRKFFNWLLKSCLVILTFPISFLIPQ